MTRHLIISAAFVAGLCVGPCAFAASLEAVRGEVTINRGDGFQRVTGPTRVRAGDLILASQGGSARLVYSDGCPVRVQPGFVVLVGATSPCKATYMAGLADGKHLTIEEPAGLGFWPFGLGTAAAFTAFCISACDDDDGGRRRASP